MTRSFRLFIGSCFCYPRMTLAIAPPTITPKEIETTKQQRESQRNLMLVTLPMNHPLEHSVYAIPRLNEF
jgi:hypothetical protein